MAFRDIAGIIAETMTYGINDLDRDVAKTIRFLQARYNCVIILSTAGGVWNAGVIDLSTNARRDCTLTAETENKYKLIKALRKQFEG